MPQELNVLCCYSCNMFQVHIAKKAKKWQCKICNEKQSLQKVFFKGSGKDCRIHVQKLNSIKQNACQMTSFETSDSTNHDKDEGSHSNQPRLEVIESKWTKYLDSSDEVNQSNSFETSQHENCGSEDDNNDSINTNDNNLGCSNECEGNASSTQNVLNNYFDYNKKRKIGFDNVSGGESSHKDNTDSDNDITEHHKKSRNIFEGDEDFDISIDF